MTKYYYADVMPDGSVRACLSCQAPEVGPPVDGVPAPQLESQTEGALVLLDAPINWAGPTPTSVLHMVDGALTWLEMGSLDEVKAAKLGSLADQFSQYMAAIKAGYPDEEVLSWAEQKAEALAYTADPTATVPLLTSMAAARGITVDDLAARVLAKAHGWAVMSGALIGKRQAYEDAVGAAAGIDEVRAIVWQA